MLFYQSKSDDPALNLATEEYLFETTNESICFLYINKPAVIIGRNQNIFAEVNHPFAQNNNIEIYRRLSGGGTVYHDHGNLNICFIRSNKFNKQTEHKEYSDILIGFLKTLALDTRYDGNNSIYMGNTKISGNAEHISRNKIMHHGTLLFNSNLSIMSNILKSPAIINDKAVKSTPAEVINIKTHTFIKTIEALQDEIKKYISVHIGALKPININEKAKNQISTIAKNKYQAWDWNYASGPTFSLKIQETIILNIEKGIIKSVDSPELEIQKLLSNCKLLRENLDKALISRNNIREEIRRFLF